ncbi:MAG TPA: non-canonical purine NTP pyrophosphatase [Candidatus Saccharimonadales bacterium]|nr:non-canonical purine NTP pyrophosphatase [Candidatus Saccharimonadales bacterium]
MGSYFSFIPKKINFVLENSQKTPYPLPFATSNQKKVEELQRLGICVTLVPEVKPIEIQGSPEEVLIAKAKDAYQKNGGVPTLVEDSSFSVDDLGGFPGSYVKEVFATRADREVWCRKISPTNRGVTFKVGLAVFDGQEAQIRWGETRGTIATSPVGRTDFAFDDIFIPGTSKKTYSQMSALEKDKTSPRAKAYQRLSTQPFSIGGEIFALQEPSATQMERMKSEELVQNTQALRFAYSLDFLQLSGIKPNKDFTVQTVPYHKVSYNKGAVVAYTTNPKSASMGLVLVPEVDLKTIPDETGKRRPVRLDVRVFPNASDPDNPIVEPYLLQMGPKAMKVALASRAAEFTDMHSSSMHQHVRDLLSGKIPHTPRSHTRSKVLEEILGMEVHTDEHGRHTITKPAVTAIATKELGYKRESSEGKLSRKAAAQGILLVGPDNVVSSLYAYGGMPPISGSVDAIVTAAMSYMRVWIPRNGVFAGNFKRQLTLFVEAKKKIESCKLPKDIEKQVIAQIGFAVGCENPKEIAKQALEFQKAGGHAVRIYTTNPDVRIVETAEAIYKAVGDTFLICVGPVTDARQARILHEDGHVRMFLIGHGGGENCTSLTAGGAANSIEILYEMYLDPLFSDSLIGLEGGTGTTIGALLPMLDVISLNRRGSGGIECTGGLYVKKIVHGKAVPVLPYHGSASAVTQLIEAYMDPGIAKRRLGLDGIVRAVEGKPNYMVMSDPARSNVNRIREARSYAGLALADQKSLSLYQLREKVAREGHNHVGISSASSVVANEHRNGI